MQRRAVLTGASFPSLCWRRAVRRTFAARSTNSATAAPRAGGTAACSRSTAPLPVYAAPRAPRRLLLASHCASDGRHAIGREEPACFLSPSVGSPRSSISASGLPRVWVTSRAAMPSSGRPPATKASRARASRPGSLGQEQFGQRVQGQPPPGGLPHREQPGDALGVDPARHSCEDFRRDGIQPLYVVHGDELRPPGAPAPSPRRAARVITSAQAAHRWYSRKPSSSPSVVQLAAAVSRLPSASVARFGHAGS
jgi:hypothetical protein